MSTSRAEHDVQGRDVSAQPAEAGAEPEQLGSVQAVMALQRSSGNQAVSRYLARKRGSLIDTAELTSRWNRARAANPLHPGGAAVRFRVPTAASITAMMSSGEVPESRIKESVQTALERMKQENKLKSTDAIPDIMLKLFPSAGKFDEAEFAKVVDVTDRTRVYQKASDAEAQLTPADKLKVIAAMDKADTLIDQAIADGTNLTRVFGSKATEAKDNYIKAKAALAKLKTNIDTKVHTDYNRDDPEVGLGGWARFSEQMVHLKPAIAAGLDPDAAAITIVHESSHLADPSVTDLGYYPASATASAGWDALKDDVKVANAAHYEEIPRRKIGKSVYKDDQEFKEGISAATGGALTFETKVRRIASEYLRKAWDAAVDVHLGLRQIRVDIEKGSDASFKAKEARIIEVSKLEKLTIHDQTPKPHTVTTLDVSLCEGVAHATVLIKANGPKQPVPSSAASGKSEKDHADEVVTGAINAYGKLTGNATDDKKLMDWMVANYQATGLL